MTNWGLAVFMYVVGGCIGFVVMIDDHSAGSAKESVLIRLFWALILGFILWPLVIGASLSHLLNAVDSAYSDSVEEEDDV